MGLDTSFMSRELSEVLAAAAAVFVTRVSDSCCGGGGLQVTYHINATVVFVPSAVYRLSSAAVKLK